MKEHTPSAIIHLGDVYYSGTFVECQDAFINAFDTVFDEILGSGNRIPVFTLPGNHDYYAWGTGFYPMLSKLNSGDAIQDASYFCLRTKDGLWQFLGMDTGYNDSDPDNAEDSFIDGPALQANEIEWHLDKLDEKKFGGSTILLSHHQVFSANTSINGETSTYAAVPYLNTSLYSTFWSYFPTKIAMWMWGHEHNFVRFENGLFGVPMGRLVGCSAYEELDTSPDAYSRVYPEVCYQLPAAQLGVNSDGDGLKYYNHGFAIIDLKRTKPSDPLKIKYYQYPSWYQNAPSSPSSSPIVSNDGHGDGEDIAAPSPPQQIALSNGATVNLRGQEGMFISAVYDDYPMLATQAPVGLTITGCGTSGNTLSDGDTVTITDGSISGSANYLGAWTSDYCYYDAYSDGNTQWVISKLSGSSNDTTINTFDCVCFTNVAYAGQSLTSYPCHEAIYMTTAADTPYYWRIIPTAKEASDVPKVIA